MTANQHQTQPPVQAEEQKKRRSNFKIKEAALGFLNQSPWQPSSALYLHPFRDTPRQPRPCWGGALGRGVGEEGLGPGRPQLPGSRKRGEPVPPPQGDPFDTSPEEKPKRQKTKEARLCLLRRGAGRLDRRVRISATSCPGLKDGFKQVW